MAYQVKLVGLQSVDYTSRPIVIKPGAHLAKYYDLPSQMPWTQHLGKQKVRKDTYHKTQFGLEERVIFPKKSPIELSFGNVVDRVERFRFTESRQKKFIGKYYENSTPLFLCNSVSTLQKLMNLSLGYCLFATKVNLDDGKYFIYLKFDTKIISPYSSTTTPATTDDNCKSFGYSNEEFLSSGDANPTFDQNKALEGIYHAKLTGLKNDKTSETIDCIDIGFLSEIDGIWNSDDSGEVFDAEDLVEVKCLESTLFSKKYDPYYYETKGLLSNWAPCKLRGMKRLLCGVIERSSCPSSTASEQVKGSMREIWLYDVDEIPRLVNKSGTKGKRCFPKVEFQNINTDQKPELYKKRAETWTEESQFQALFDNLNIIKESFQSTDNDHAATSMKKYFFAHKCGSHKSTESASAMLDEITEAQYNEIGESKHLLFLKITKNKYNYNDGMLRKEILDILKNIGCDDSKNISAISIVESSINSLPLLLIRFQSHGQRDEIYKAFMEKRNQMKQTKSSYYKNDEKTDPNVVFYMYKPEIGYLNKENNYSNLEPEYRN